MPPMRIGAFALSFVAVAALVHLGATDSVDRFGREHLQAESFDTALDWLSTPANPLIYAAVLAAVCATLVHRGRAREAMLWVAVTATGVVIEVLGKLSIDTRFNDPDHVFDLFTLQNAFPSGHAMRSVLLVGLAAAVLPATRRLAAAWAAVACIAILIGGIHVASEVVGGILVAAMLLAAMASDRLTTRRWPPQPQPARS
ncbi:MAG: hypothetical protein QOJ13_3181 [Gaiellales bacterium]|jgi:membrane-associated phospholipid phosphatase|nr:hypothetical protein [Gaiellales bacterium]